MGGDDYDDLDFAFDDGDEEMSDEDIAAESCGRWNNGRLMRHCTKAGSEECDWECPYSH